MKKRKKTGVRSTRTASARPTREQSEPKPKPKLREGGRQSSPFKSEWKYLDLTRREKGGGSAESTPQGRDRADRSQRSLPSRSVHKYYTPPKPSKPFRDLSDEEIARWLLKRPGDYRLVVTQNAETWMNCRGKKAAEIVAYRHGTGTMPTTHDLAEYLRAMATPPCSCGHNGNPFDRHEVDARKCFRNKPAALEDDDDDDLPF